MKILFASSSSGSRGGGETYLLYLGHALAERGHEVELWVSSHPRMEEMATRFAAFGAVTLSDYRNTYDRPGRSLAAWLDRGTARRAAGEWAGRRAEVVHINKQNLEDGLDLLRAARMTAVPSVCTIHLTQTARYLGARLAGLRDAVSRGALRAYPGTFVAVLETRRRELQEFLGPASRTRAICNGVPLFPHHRRAALRAATRAELGVADDDLLVLGIGRMMPQKRPLRFLGHAVAMLEQVPNARFVWVGDGPLSAEWDAAVAARGWFRTVQRVGWQSEVGRFLAAADLVLHVAEYEGLPLALLEAMAAGVPCAIGENLLAEMPFLNGTNSIPVSGDAGLWAQLNDRPSLISKGSAARMLIEAEFSFARMASEYEELYAEAIRGPG